MNKWKWANKNNIDYIYLPEWLEEGVDAAFSGRWGGVSNDIFKSLNMGLHVSDEKDRVLENRRRYLDIFSISLENTVSCQQVHGNRIVRVGKADRGKGIYDYSESIPDCDGMITNEKDVYLLCFYADCLPLYFYDPENRVIGLAHSGWKGTMGRIAEKTLQAMQSEFNTSIAKTCVFIGPGVGKCCFEIKADLIDRVKKEFKNFSNIIYNNEKDIFTWDLNNTNKQILVNYGVNPANIISCGLCTACNVDLFYSYRQENGKTGRMAAVIGLRS